jgi:hypothetical protein
MPPQPVRCGRDAVEVLTDVLLGDPPYRNDPRPAVADIDDDVGE